ncbi:hypothetical protein MASR1M46_06580 [Bacteroidales bacterium]
MCSNTYRINGLEGQYSQILLDSRLIFSSRLAVYGEEQIASSMIERVEVSEGRLCRFGSNAIGGVIITKELIRNIVSVSNQTTSLEMINGLLLLLLTAPLYLKTLIQESIYSE